MLVVAYKYREAINDLTSNRDLKLRSYEVEEEEWDIVKQLRDVLKVWRNHSEFQVVY